jgi:hypothetical protein
MIYHITPSENNKYLNNQFLKELGFKTYKSLIEQNIENILNNSIETYIDVEMGEILFKYRNFKKDYKYGVETIINFNIGDILLIGFINKISNIRYYIYIYKL